MLALIKYSFLALGGRLWFFLAYLLLSMGSHLLDYEGFKHWQDIMLLVYLFLSVIAYIILLEAVFFRGITQFHLLYQQIPLGPEKLLASHLIMVFTISAVFLYSFFSFSHFAPMLMPYGFTLLVGANMISFLLYITALSLTFLMFAATAAKKKGLVFLYTVTALFLFIYLLAFWIRLDIFGLLLAPIISLTEGFAAPADNLLQTPWPTLWVNLAKVIGVLLLQFASLVYLFSGKIDLD